MEWTTVRIAGFGFMVGGMLGTYPFIRAMDAFKAGELTAWHVVGWMGGNLAAALICSVAEVWLESRLERDKSRT